MNFDEFMIPKKKKNFDEFYFTCFICKIYAIFIEGCLCYFINIFFFFSHHLHCQIRGEKFFFPSIFSPPK